MEQINDFSTTFRQEINRRTFFRAVAGLLGFGVVYDQVVNYCHKRGYDDGYTALLVVGGVGVTLLAAVPVIGRRNAERIFWLFVASGTPMILGDIGRFAKNRSEHREWINGEGRYGEVPSKGMAWGRRAVSDAWESDYSTQRRGAGTGKKRDSA